MTFYEHDDMRCFDYTFTDFVYNYNKTYDSNILLQINNNRYNFKHSILCLGKNFTDKAFINKHVFTYDHKSYVGFFKHSKQHYQTAYEIFTPNGPLAILPAPNKSKKLSTFIYSSNKKNSYQNIKTLIKKYFHSSHGELIFDKANYQFEILPHFSKPKSYDFFLEELCRLLATSSLDHI